MSSLLIVFILSFPLPDFSRAGCEIEVHSKIPSNQVNIVDYGAVPNDELDDSGAIQQAIDSLSTSGGTVVFPSGTFVLEKRIKVHTNTIHLLGNETTLHCPKPLAEVYGENRNWSWSSGFLLLHPIGESKELGTIKEIALDGATTVEVGWNSEPPKVGQWVQFWWYNDTGSDTLFKWLYGDAVSPKQYGRELQESKSRRVVSWFKVISVDGDTCTFDPPLPMPVELQWNVQVIQVPHLKHCIVENFHFDFGETQYPGHLKERGHNAIAGSALVECLFKNISTKNADSGIIFSGCGFTTVEGFTTTGRIMHHPICLSSCSHCLVEEFTLNAPHIHGTTISWCSHFNVFTNGIGNELAMDSHRACSFRNLHQNIKIHHSEYPQQPLRSGGAYNRGLHSARENVYWNIEHIFPTSGEPFEISYLQQWPLGVFVGWHGNREILLKQALKGQVIEQINMKPTESLY
jgi:hypothetical protein